MPIQITELNIAVSVTQPNPQSAQASTGAAKTNPDEAKQWVDECVDQVVKIIRDKKER